jgi:hypothetical protein
MIDQADELTRREFDSGNYQEVKGLVWFTRLGYGYLPQKKPFAYDMEYYLHYVELERHGLAFELSKRRAEFSDKYISDRMVIDVGIGAGTFIKVRNWKWKKANTFGTDVCEEGLLWLREQGLEYSLTGRDCEVATFWDSLEHTLDASVYLAKVKDIAVITTPEYPDNPEGVMKSKHFKPDEHIYYFTREGIENFMDYYGFELKEISEFERGVGRQDITSYIFARKK